ncbi:hypothetical protein, partial [Lactiplantibacillus plantarum]|uniref:hypothetical protein n=1 Tax=Lactiplantibacillus plantarum TaxID=1590 RepID=UPI001EE9A158
TVSGYADKFVQKFGLNLQSTMCHKLICHSKIIAVLAVNLMTIHAIKAVCCDYDGLCVDYG